MLVKSAKLDAWTSSMLGGYKNVSINKSPKDMQLIKGISQNKMSNNNLFGSKCKKFV